jgi:hypothetical protein
MPLDVPFSEPDTLRYSIYIVRRSLGQLLVQLVAFPLEPLEVYKLVVLKLDPPF